MNLEMNKFWSILGLDLSEIVKNLYVNGIF